MISGEHVSIRAAIRHDDVVGRISGDEFVILFRGYRSEADVRSTADRIVAALKQPMTVHGCDLRLSATFGIALYPDHGCSYDDLRRAADIAMYTAKHTAKGTVSYFTAEMGVAALAQMRLEERLRQAITDREFRCVYQPKFDLTSMTVVGFEALVRWVDEDGHVHQPLAFIEAAGRFGLLDDITMLVVEDVLHSLPLLDLRYGAATQVSFNVSARQIANVTFMDRLVARLAASPWCRRLMLEATEEAFIEADILRDTVIPKLRRAGIRLSIDDFGRGYSSLSTLADIPADEVKVDRAFITDIDQRPRNQIVLKAIESLCGALGMAVIAEGIETKAELDYLMNHTSIRSGQGFLLERPFFIENKPTKVQLQAA
jgi:cyclic di-GMP phosphodiesterase Gmr